MYEAFYGLKERPFNLTPDPRFLYLSEKHKEAFAHLLYGIKNRSGFVMVSGEIGTGKTTICRTLLGQLDDDTEVAFIFNPCLSPEELLRKINEDFGIDSRAETMKGLIDELNAYLLEHGSRGKNCVLVIDEAQNLSPGVLEQVRLLSNLETETAKLLQIVLIGQPELAQSLELPELRQLNQRITARYHLKALDASETLQYIAYRLRVAGGRRKIRFSKGAVRAVYKFSKGTPRVINAICDRALLIGYTQEATDITTKMIRRATREIRGERMTPARKKSVWRAYLPNPTAAMVTLAFCATGLYLFGPWNSDRYTGAGDAPSQVSSSANRGERSPSPLNTVSATVQETKSSELQESVAPARRTELAAALAALDPAIARNAAATALVRAWNMALLSGYPESDAPESMAAFASANGLTAEALTLSLDQLKTINLPAFIRLTGDQSSVWVALVGADGDKLKITTRVGETISAPRGEIAAHYANRAILLWRDTAPNTPALREGMDNAAVRKLQEQLRSVGRLSEPPTGVYDAKTVAAVRALQEVAGLTADGIAGRQTRMLLASWDTSSSPALDRLATVPSAALARTQPVTEPKEIPDEAPTPAPPAAAPASPPAPVVDQAAEARVVAPNTDTKAKELPELPAAASPAPLSWLPSPLAPAAAVKEEELPPLGGAASLPPSKSAVSMKEITPPATTAAPLLPSDNAAPNRSEAKSG
ncbi:MAG: AAA family ATPase [Candidatus Hydrogenedentes bacterium]|nr:AAA family ATPase [Candidatus Hydrogenedentota bacterium]